ncbi:MAG: Rab family GTPase [Promethearchaeota archaeon]|jgi:small GTP-binding protein
MKTTIKIIVSGDGGVGKTSFLNRLINDTFDMNNELTKGVDFFSKDVVINGYEYNFVLWDFAGQNQFKKLLSDFVNGSLAAFILFDLTRFKTLEGVEEWIYKLRQYGDIPAFIIGTKSDIVTLNETQAFDAFISKIIKNNKTVLGYIKISSKTGVNVKEAFYNLLQMLSN